METEDYVPPLSVDDFVKLAKIAHVLKSPDMYVDSIRQIRRNAWLLYPDGIMRQKEISIPQALTNMFREILGNACDNVDRSLRARVDPGIIEITMNKYSVTIKNGGVPIPIQVHQQTNMWLPQLLFSKLRTGSNFGDKRYGGGRNGMGSVLVNALSNYFQADIGDPVRGKRYVQLWSNLDYYREDLNCSPPSITDYCGPSYVSITYQAEFVRFGYDDGYPDDALYAFMKDAADASLSCKVPVVFNNQLMDYRSIVDYAKLYFGPLFNYVTHYQWSKTADVVTNVDNSQSSVSGLILPTIEAIIVDSISPKVSVGLCNSVFNMDGGMHVDAVYDTLFKSVLDISTPSEKVREKIKRRELIAKRRKAKTKTKGKAKTKTEKVVASLERKDIKRNISVIINVRVTNPEWKGQMKSAMRTFIMDDGKTGTLRVVLTESEFAVMRNWSFVARIENELKNKRQRLMCSTDGKKTPRVPLKKGKDCTWAGTNKSESTILIGFEGDSAMQYSNYLRKAHPNGHAQIGLIPTGGKIINVSERDIEDIALNPFLVEFKSMMGIKEGVDYTNSVKLLRYGMFWLMTDADLDGRHIKGLLINFINRLYPSLMNIPGFIREFVTKSKTVEKNGQLISFYSDYEYDLWRSITPDWHTWVVKHYKGLGTSSKEEAISDWHNQYLITIVKDRMADPWLDLAFLTKKTDGETKKKWIASYNDAVTKPHTHVPKGGIQLISDFIAQDLVAYMSHDVVRHMPKRDGLNVTMRKILYLAIKKWKWWTKGKESEARLIAFAYEVMGKTDYDHGDLTEVVIRMSQDFVGSNNITYFIPKGMFGSRDAGGKDHAAARYLNTWANKTWRHVFQQRDNDLLNYLPGHQEGTIEPAIYYPTIPPYLINGVECVMSGHSSFIPSHNPLEIIQWLRYRLQGYDPRTICTLIPFYKGFRGTISVEDKRTLVTNGGKYLVDDTVDNGVVATKASELRGRFFMLSTGCVEILSQDEGMVTELPIGVWTTTYLKLLDKMISAGKITSCNDESDTESVRIRVSGFKVNRPLTIDDFKIRKCKPIQLKILGDNNNPIKFNTVHDMLEDFYRWRYPIYQRRRLLDIEAIRKQVSAVVNKSRFIGAVTSGQLVTKTVGRSEKDVVTDIQRLGLDEKLYLTKQVNERSYSIESMNRLEAKYKSLLIDLTKAEEATVEQIWLSDLDKVEKDIVSVFN